MTTLDDLKQKCPNIPGLQVVMSDELFPTYEGNRPLLIVENSLAKLVLSPHGAHVISFIPADGDDLLWMSPQCVMTQGQPIRGGIPLCLPWFGPGVDGRPQHGYGRINDWELENVTAEADGSTSLVLTQPYTTGDLPTPGGFDFRLEINVGKALGMDLSATNRTSEEQKFELAYHTYFNVGDVRKTTVEGLDGVVSINGRDDNRRATQQGAVSVEPPVQMVYLDVPQTQWVRSPAGDCCIDGDSQAALIWNPGTDDADVPDIGAGNHKGFICVERMDAREQAVTLAPGQTHRAKMSLSRP